MTQTAESLVEIGQSLTHAHGLGPGSDALRIELLASKTSVADSTMKASVRDASGRPRGFIVCSPSISPDLVARSISRARQAKAVVGPVLGKRIIEPLVEGSVRGLSYAVFPYCDGLSTFLPIRVAQRWLITRSILEWLFQVNKQTIHEVSSARLADAFARPLERLESMPQVSGNVRAVAAKAQRRLESSKWKPRHVLMHGDLWLGNVLLKCSSAEVPRWRWADRAVVIDWPGSEVDGYAIYDLIRLSQSANLGRTILRKELMRHCELLDCELLNAMSHLAAALGYIAITLEHFPIDRYARMAERCVMAVQDFIA